MGEGIAIRPTSGEVYAPFDGKIQMIFPTKHAFGLVSDNGLELLIHVGLDTVKLNGEGFTVHVEEGQTMKAGDNLMTVDLDLIRASAKSDITPIIVTQSEVTALKFTEAKDVKHGEKLFEI